MAFMVLGTNVSAVQVHEGHKLDIHRSEDSRTGSMRVAACVNSRVLDLSWLKYAAETYVISPNPEDYVISDVPPVVANVPNRNMDCFTEDELVRYDPRIGRTVFSTFVGKPSCFEHDNQDPRKAKGVLLDARLSKARTSRGQEVMVVRVLAGFDRTKDSKLANEIEEGKRPYYSMGAFVDYVTCPRCKGTNYSCTHFGGSAQAKGIVTPDGWLLYDECRGANFIELSSVEDPANVFAGHTVVF